MNATVKEWIDKAESDYNTAWREVRVEDLPNWDAVCFHAQQCAEKLLKAVLISRQVVPPRIHDLVRLSAEVTRTGEEWSWPERDLIILSRASVDLRYPGEFAGRDEAHAAFEVATAIREALLEILQPGT